MQSLFVFGGGGTILKFESKLIKVIKNRLKTFKEKNEIKITSVSFGSVF